MKVKDLMIGDAVMYQGEGKIYHISEIGICNVQFAETPKDTFRSVSVNHIEPIPLTAEILEKNFGEPSRFGPLDRVCWGCIERLVGVRLFELDTCFWVEIDTQQTGQKNESDNCHIKKYIRYVHELQHAMKLCGIEKEIII